MTMKLGYWATLSLVVGNIIGVGIFTTTGYMIQYIDSAFWVLIAWLLGALYALSGAVVYGILANKYPLSGGDYQYLSKASHPIIGYVFGWSCFFVTYSGSIAALSIAATYYLNGLIVGFNMETVVFSIPLAQLDITLVKILAIMIILLFTWINYRGIIVSGRYQIFLTTTIVVFLISFSIAGMLSPSANIDYLFLYSENGLGSFSGFFVALIAVLFAYMGWTTAVYVAEEIENAGKTIPSSLMVGVLVIGFLYLWINLVYLITVPLLELKNVVNIGTLVATRLWGSQGNIIISGFIFIAILSSINSTILSGPRIYWAMARDSFFYGFTERLHPRFGTPYVAIILQAAWCIILVITGSFSQLLSFVVFIAIVFSILAGFIALKIHLQKVVRKSWQTLVILFYLLFCCVILINTLWQRPLESISGVILVSLALPVYYSEYKRIRK